MIRSNTLVLFLGDIAIFIGGLFIALLLRYGAWPTPDNLHEHLNAFSGIFVLWVIVFLIAGLYDTKVNLSRKKIPAIIIRAQFVNMALAAFVFFLFPIGLTPKITLLIYIAVTTPLIALWRLFLSPYLAMQHTERALIVGGGEEARSLTTILNEGTFFKFMIADTLDPKQFVDTSSFERALHEYIRKHHVGMIIGDMHSPEAAALVPIYFELAFLHQHVAFLSLHQQYEEIFHRIPPSLVRESWILENISRETHVFDDIMKRAFDIIGALALGVLTLPLYPLIYVLIKSEDGGPIFYRTERIGKNNASIWILKFRTMNGQDRGHAALKSELTVTRVGRFLRKTRLDEIPQFWNILRGDLSFIGPRPEMPTLAAVYAKEIPYYPMRHMITPGLSGWAQITDFAVPRGVVDVERTLTKLSFDLYYLKHRSFLLDLEIALKTIKTLLLRSGT